MNIFGFIKCFNKRRAPRINHFLPKQKLLLKYQTTKLNILYNSFITCILRKSVKATFSRLKFYMEAHAMIAVK